MEQSHVHKTDKTGNKRIWLFVALGVLLLLSVFRALGSVTEALALEQQPRCGMTEHLHTESCYINDVLVCRQKAHTHSDSCYPLLLADNDINQLLTQIASTRDRSLESLLRSGNVRGILVLNKDLRVQTTQEDNAEVDSPWIGGVGLLAQHRLQRHQLLHPSGREYHLHRQQDPDHQPKYPPALKNQRGQRLYRCGGDITDHR